MPPSYPTHAEILTLFSHLSTDDSSPFFARVADDVDWRILGHSPMSGQYRSKADFQAATLKVLNEKVLKQRLAMIVDSVVVGSGGEDGQGDGQAVVEMHARDGTQCRDGTVYDMTYCWVVQFNESGIITKVRAYIDTELLTRAVERNK